MQVIKNSTAFVLSFVISNSSKYFTRYFSYEGDALDIKHTKTFASLDIKSLYTQILLNEVIEDILTAIYD